MQGKPLGLLHGIPFAAKDLVNTAGVRTTFGSLHHENNVPKEDAVAAARMKAGRRDPVRQDDDARVRPQGADRRAAVRPHAQRLERRAHLGRLERRRGGRGGGRHRADRHRDRRRRLDAHSRGGQRHGRAEAEQRRHPAQPGRRRLRQLHLRHADDAHGDGHRADAAGDGRPASVRSVVDRHRAAGLHRRGRAPTATSRASASSTALTLGQHSSWPRTCAPPSSARSASCAISAPSWSSSPTTLPDMEPIWKVINHTTWRARFDDMIRREDNDVSPSLVRQVAHGRANGPAPTTSAPCSSAPISSAWCRAGSRRPTIS